jgi:hypothetical protein
MRVHLDIYIPIALQWHNENFNPMIFDPCNRPLKIRESTRTPTPKVRAHLGVWGFIPSHSLTLLGAWNVTPRLHFWPAPLQALALIVSPKLRLRHLVWFHLHEVSTLKHQNVRLPHNRDYVCELKCEHGNRCM